MIYGWEFYEKRRPFDEYAAPQGNDRSFFLATCGTLELWTADPVVASEVLQRTGDFNIPTITGLLFAQFGHNVFTTNGARWAKQRKVIASVINDGGYTQTPTASPYRRHSACWGATGGC